MNFVWSLWEKFVLHGYHLFVVTQNLRRMTSVDHRNDHLRISVPSLSCNFVSLLYLKNRKSPLNLESSQRSPSQNFPIFLRLCLRLINKISLHNPIESFHQNFWFEKVFFLKALITRNPMKSLFYERLSSGISEHKANLSGGNLKAFEFIFVYFAIFIS